MVENPNNPYNFGTPLYKEYEAAQANAAKQAKSAQVAKQLAEQGLKVQSVGPLSRTAAGILSGKIATPLHQTSSHVQRQVGIARAEQDLFAGKISFADYEKQVGFVREQVAKTEAREDEYRRNQSVTRAQSATLKQNFESGFTTATKEQGYTTTGTAETARQSAVIRQQNQKLLNESGLNYDVEKLNKAGLSTLYNQTPLQKNTGFPKNIQSGKTLYIVTVNGKERRFNSLEAAEIFTKRTGKPIQGPVKPLPALITNAFYSFEDSIGPKNPDIFKGVPGGLEYAFGKKDTKISADLEPNNLLQNFGASLWNSLRYSDRVKSGEVPEPKGIELLPFYASKGLSPLYSIPLSLSGDKNVQPTFLDTIFNTGIQLVTTGKTKTHDPIGDYIKKDPLGTAVQLPAEAALWITGTKVVSVIKNVSPLAYQSEKILTSSGKVATTIRSITFKDNPVISLQNGKIIKGFSPEQYPYEKINVATREGFEAALGSGFEKSIYYSPKALQEQVRRGIIPDIGATRAGAWVDAVNKGLGSSPSKGTLGELPIEGLTQKQADFIFKGVKTGQKEGTIDLIHGSPATRAGVPESIQKQAGSALQLGDVDITPKGKNLTRIADKLAQGFAQNFPLEPGQRLSIKNLGKGENVNRALQLSDPTWDEPKKILEVVLRKSEQSKEGIMSGKKILGYNIPKNKSLLVSDYGVKTNIADYQLLTNVKQALAYQKGSKTLFDIYTSSGRTKDIVRGYWNLKGKAVFKGNKELDTKADYIRSLYPGLEFTDVKPEKILLSSSKVESKVSDNLIEGAPVNIKNISPSKEDSARLEKLKGSSRDVFSSRNIGSSRDVFSSRNIGSSRDVFSSRNISSSRDVFSSRNTDSIRNIVGSSKGNGGSTRGSIKTPPSIAGVPSLIQPPTKTPSLKGPIPSLTGLPSKTAPSKPPPSITSGGTKDISSLYRTKKIPVVFVPNILNTTKKAPGKKWDTHNFLGSSRVAEITGFRTIKADLTVGDKKTARLYSEDLEKSRKSFKGITGKKSKNLRRLI